MRGSPSSQELDGSGQDRRKWTGWLEVVLVGHKEPGQWTGWWEAVLAGQVRAGLGNVLEQLASAYASRESVRGRRAAAAARLAIACVPSWSHRQATRKRPGAAPAACYGWILWTGTVIACLAPAAGACSSKTVTAVSPNVEPPTNDSGMERSAVPLTI